MDKLAYIKGLLAALTHFKVAFLAGMGSSNNVQSVGMTRGYPLDSEPRRRYNTIERAFATNDNLPSATSTTEEPPNRAP